jgi:amidohydrolase
MTSTFSPTICLASRRRRRSHGGNSTRLHAHPELAFENTARPGCRPTGSSNWVGTRPCPTVTGAVARPRGSQPGRRVMIRADIDGLPVTEERAISYASVNEGVMHACGHDVHTAGLLGVADLLARRRDDLAGEFTLLFQPAEEAMGGAKAMIEGGVLTNNPVDVVIGAHVSSLAPLGLRGTKPGVMMSEAVSRSRSHQGQREDTERWRASRAMSSSPSVISRLDSAKSSTGSSSRELLRVLGRRHSAGTAMNVVPRHARAARYSANLHPRSEGRGHCPPAGACCVEVEDVLVTCTLRSSAHEGTPGGCEQR